MADEGELTQFTDVEEPDAENEEGEDTPLPERSRDLSRLKYIRDQLLPIYREAEQGFSNQVERSNDQMDYWDIYNCKLGPKQFYTGNSKIYVPLVHNAVNARQTRFVNQIFPQSGRYVDVTTEDGTRPQAVAALLEHYVRKAKLRTQIMPALMRNGDVEGQYTVCVSWCERKRHVAWKTATKPEVEALEVPGVEEIEDIREETIVDAYPEVEVIADADLLVIPATADSIDEAIASGGSVTVIRRWSAAKIRKLIKEGAVNKEAGQALIRGMSRKSETARFNKEKAMVDAAGIKTNDNNIKHALVYETWAELRVRGEQRICRIFFGGEDNILGCTLNPYWSDRVPIFSVPVEKIAGSFKGLSKIKFCADQQYAANDATNMGNDSAAFSLMPIVMTDPEKNPRIGSMVLALSAIWETSPNDTQFSQFPQLWEQALQIVAAARAEIATALSVSPAAITQQGSEKGLNQGEIANEQQVDLLTTADAVTVLEEGILTPLLGFMAELDHQYRDDELLVRQYGDMGVRANMERIPPIQMDRRYQFTWFGVESARNAQQIQQQIAGMNVIRGIPPDQYVGYKLNLVPIISQLVENLFGPRMAPLIFENMRDQMSLDPMFENALLAEGIDMAVHPFDDDNDHMQKHMALLQASNGDPTGVIRVHMMRHKLSLEQKTAAMMAPQQGQAGAPGVPGGAIGGQQQPGVAGTPRIGAQPGGPRPNGQGPPGMIHRDQLRDPRAAPRQ